MNRSAIRQGGGIGYGRPGARPSCLRQAAGRRPRVDRTDRLRRPRLDLEQSHQATVCCHLANIAYLTGRHLKWDGKRESILGDPQACGLLERPRREGYELPEA